ncbi:MAG: nucleotidyltransferase family protein [Caulobacteraceae bacterium]
MHKVIEERRAEIAEVCRRFAVRRLEVFGSAARGDDFDRVRSDADFLVTFDADAGASPLKRYLDFAETLEALLGRRVDLLDREALEQNRNHFRRRAILADAQPIYG